MSINLTDEIEVKTKKGKLGAAKQIFLEGDTQNVEKEIQDINSRHSSLNTKHESLSRTVQGIAATGGASTANNVTYNNNSSRLNAENVQDAIDEVSNMVIYDVSACNKGTVFESLSALLSSPDLNKLIPTSVRHGGMIIRFIQGYKQSSDNKYVQYRCMSNEFTTDTTQWSIADEGVYVENPEFAYVKTDAEGKILWAIKIDGGIYYGAGCPQQVKDYIEEKLAGFSPDKYEDIVAFLSDYLVSDTTLKTLIDSKLDAEGLDSDALGTIQAVENPEYIQVTIDSEDRILQSRDYEGVNKEYVGIETPMVSVDGNIMKNIQDKEGRTEIKTDSEDKILSYRDSNGVIHENVEINTPNIVVNGVDILDKIEQNDLNANSSIWESGEVSVSTGELSTNNKRIRCIDIKKHELTVKATGGYMFSIYVYNRGRYIGCYGDAGSISTVTIKWWKNLDLTGLSDLHPEYSFNIVACRVDVNGTPIEDVMTASEGNCIKMLTPFEMKLFEKDTFCPIVSFIDDDLMFDSIDNWYSIAEGTGIRIGFATITSMIDNEGWKTIRRLQSDGFDFLSHTHNHINLMNETDHDVIKADLQASIDAFNNNGVRVSGLVYPQSSISDMALNIVEQYFEFSFNGGRGLESIQGNPCRKHNIIRTDTTEPNTSDYTDPDTSITYQVHAMLPLDTLKSYIDKAVNENCWVIFESHFRNSYQTGDGFIFTPEMRQRTIALIEYAISKGCRVATPTEGYQILKNRLMRGIYGSNNYYIVDHNGFIYRKNM